MCDLKSHTAFRAKAEQGGHGGHSWGMAVGIPLLPLPTVLRSSTAGHLSPTTTHTHVQASCSVPASPLTHTQAIFYRVLILVS